MECLCKGPWFRTKSIKRIFWFTQLGRSWIFRLSAICWFREFAFRFTNWSDCKRPNHCVSWYELRGGRGGKGRGRVMGLANFGKWGRRELIRAIGGQKFGENSRWHGEGDGSANAKMGTEQSIGGASQYPHKRAEFAKISIPSYYLGIFEVKTLKIL